jgi:outer membrane protein
LVEEYKSLSEKATDLNLDRDAKAKAKETAERKREEIRRKQDAVNRFVNNARAPLQRRMEQFRSMLLDEIRKVVIRVAQGKVRWTPTIGQRIG